MMTTFDLQLTANNRNAGCLRVAYNEQGFISADYLVADKLPDRLNSLMLQSSLFAPVMEQINSAIENNRESLLNK